MSEFRDAFSDIRLKIKEEKERKANKLRKQFEERVAKLEAIESSSGQP